MNANRENVITTLARIPASTDGKLICNILVEFLASSGFEDIADAVVTAFNASTLTIASTIPTAVSAKIANRPFKARTHHER